MKFYFILFFLLLTFSLSAQTLLGPTFGYDFATLETRFILVEEISETTGWLERPLEIRRSQKDTPSGRKSITFGFQVQKTLSPNWTLGMRGSYSRKEYTEYIRGANIFTSSIYEVFYRQAGISLLFNRKIKEKISIGLGPSVYHFSGWDSANPDSNTVPDFPFKPYQVTKRAYSLNLQAGYYLGPVYLAVDYMRTLKISDASDYMTGASSLAFTGTYFFELKKRKG